MSIYNKKTWVNGIDATNQTNLNHIEDGIAAVPGTYLFAPGSSYLLINAATINSGSTSTYTATGGSTGVPAGAKAVILNLYFNATAAGAYLNSKPHSASTPSNNTAYPVLGTIQAANQTACFPGFIMPVDSNGQFDLTGQGGTASANINCSIMGYII